LLIAILASVVGLRPSVFRVVLRTLARWGTPPPCDAAGMPASSLADLCVLRT
jgi:hypothetical protein